MLLKEKAGAQADMLVTEHHLSIGLFMLLQGPSL